MSARLRLAAKLLAVGAGAALLGGCSGGERQIDFTTADGSHRYFQKFDHACVGVDAHGEYDIVVFTDPIYDAVHTSGSLAIDPAAAADPTRQMMRLHVFWQGAAGNVVREAAVTNASLAWYVMDTAAGRTTGVLTYEGAGFVSVDVHGAWADVTITDGRIKPVSAKGNVRDAIGPAIVSGSFRAVNDSGEVRQVLRQLDDMTQAAGQ